MTTEWCDKHLGLPIDECTLSQKDKKGKNCWTQWNPFNKNTTSLQPSKKGVYDKF